MSKSIFTSDAGSGLVKNDSLTEMLHTWHGIDPPAGFEAAVWQRIDGLNEKTIAASGDLARVLLWPRAAWVLSLAAVLVGVALGAAWSRVAGSPPSRHASTEALFNAQTLAGAYVNLLSGGAR